MKINDIIMYVIVASNIITNVSNIITNVEEKRE